MTTKNVYGLIATQSGLYAVHGTGPDDVYVCGENGALFHRRAGGGSPDGGVSDGGAGATWVALDSGAVKHLDQMWAASADDVYVAGDAGTILHSTDRGKTWKAETSGTTSNLFSVWGAGSSDVFVVGTDGVVLHKSGGGDWVTEAVGTTESFYAVWAGDPSTVYAGATGGVLVKRK